MTQKEIIRKAIEFLRVEMNTFGFIAQIKEQGFFRRDNSATYFYTFLIYNRTNIKTGSKGFQLEPYATIHIPEIEGYFKEVTTNKELKTEWSFTTIGNSVANLVANPDGINRKGNESLDLYIFDEAHIKLVADELLKHFNKVALPFFLTNNTVKRVDELLNKYPREYCVYMNNDLYRFVKGLIAAKLNKNPRLTQLLQEYNKLVVEREMPDYCKEEMSRLKRILSMIGTNITFP